MQKARKAEDQLSMMTETRKHGTHKKKTQQRQGETDRNHTNHTNQNPAVVSYAAHVYS